MYNVKEKVVISCLKVPYCSHHFFNIINPIWLHRGTQGAGWERGLALGVALGPAADTSQVKA